MIPDRTLQYRVPRSPSSSLVRLQTRLELLQLRWSHDILEKHLGQHCRHEWWEEGLDSVIFVQSG